MPGNVISTPLADEELATSLVLSLCIIYRRYVSSNITRLPTSYTI